LDIDAVGHHRGVRLPQCLQCRSDRLAGRVPDADVARVLGEVGGGHVAPVTLVDGDVDVEVEVGVDESS